MLSSLTSGLHIVRTQLSTDSATRRFAALIVVANLVMIGLPGALELLGRKPRPQFNIEGDGSLLEMLNYAHAAICALLLVGLLVRLREPVFAALAVLFTAIGLDDSLSYHDKFGATLVHWLSLPALPGLRSLDTGELMSWALAAAVLAPLLALTARRAGPFAMSVTLVLLLCLAALIVCGAGIDMLHILYPIRIVAYLEDGGEMLSLAGAAIACFAFWRAAWQLEDGTHDAALGGKTNSRSS